MAEETEKRKTKEGKKVSTKSESEESKESQKPGTEEKPSGRVQGEGSLIEQIKQAQSASEKRNFNQTYDLIFNLKGVDLTKPENRFSTEIKLPAGRGKKQKIAFVASTLQNKAKKYADTVVSKGEIENLAQDQRKLRKLVKSHQFFLAESTLMPDVGKHWGQILGPRGKMPKPVPPNAKIEPIVKSMQKSVRVSLKKDPVIQVPVGTEEMEPEKVRNNIKAVYDAVTEELPQGRLNIRSAFLKLTMGRPVKLKTKGEL